MTVDVRIPSILQPHTGGATLVTVEAGTAGTVVASLLEAHPGLGSVLVERDGSLKRFVNLFVDHEDVRYLQGMATPVHDGADVVLLPAVAGG